MLFGKKIKELREKQGLLQRQLAAVLEIDTPMFSKIERGDRKAKREQVICLAQQLKVDEKELLTIWLADKVIDVLDNENDISHDAIAFKKHHTSISKMLDQNKDQCYKIINNADGVYFGRKTFIRLYIAFYTCFGIIFLEIVYGLLKLFGG